MTKMIVQIINNCYDCPYHEQNWWGENKCYDIFNNGKTKTIKKDEFPIPEWCSLEDVVKEK